MISVKGTDQGQLKIQLTELLYYIFLVLMFFTKGIGLYDGQTIYKLIFVAAMLCIVAKLALSEHTIGEWLVIGILGILAVIVTRHSGEKGVLICYAVIVGMHGIPLKRVMQIGAWIYGICMIGMVTYYGVFLEQSMVMPAEKFGVADAARYGMGYPHPNTFHVTYLAVCALVIYCLGKKYNWKHALLLMLGDLYIFSYSMSYTAMITSTVLIITALYVSKKGRLSKLEYGIAALALPVVLAISILAPFVLSDGVKAVIQENFGTVYSRLMLSEMYVTKDNISLLGTQVTDVTSSVYSLDNSFLYCLVFNGVLFSVIILIIYILMMHRLIRGKRIFELLITCVFLLQAVLEPFMFNTSFKNITLFFAGAVIWENRELVEGKCVLARKIRVLQDRTIGLDLEKWKELSFGLQNWWSKIKKKVLLADIGCSLAIIIIYLAVTASTVSNAVEVIESLRSGCCIVWTMNVVLGLLGVLAGIWGCRKRGIVGEKKGNGGMKL